MVAVPSTSLLVLEVRDEKKRKVRFAALLCARGEWLWKDVELEEPWWLSLLAADEKVVVIQAYDNRENPDTKSIHVYDIETLQLLWARENFSFDGLQDGVLSGMVGPDDQVQVCLEAVSGREVSQAPSPLQAVSSMRPHLYRSGTGYFDTVSGFLRAKLNVSAIAAVEYLEYNKLIIISYNIETESGLANYLLVTDENGEVLMNEKIDEQLKGLGMDTFFIFAGCLFYIRNKTELLSYNIL